MPACAFQGNSTLMPSAALLRLVSHHTNTGRTHRLFWQKLLACRTSEQALLIAALSGSAGRLFWQLVILYGVSEPAMSVISALEDVPLTRVPHCCGCLHNTRTHFSPLSHLMPIYSWNGRGSRVNHHTIT